MWTNFIDAAARTLCRRWNGLFGFFPSACLNDAGRPALFLVAVVVVLICVLVAVGWKRFNRQRR